MKTRLVLFPIETVLALFKDYMGLLGVPEDAQVEQLLLNEQERKMMLVISSPTFSGPQAPEEVKFDLQRTVLVN